MQINLLTKRKAAKLIKSSEQKIYDSIRKGKINEYFTSDRVLGLVADYEVLKLKTKRNVYGEEIPNLDDFDCI